MSPILRSGTALVAALGAAVSLAGCGGDETEPSGRAGGELAERADEAERVLEEQLGDLTGVRSADDLSNQLAEARGELDHTADRLQRTDASDELEDERDELERALRDLSRDVRDAQVQVDDGDLSGALGELDDLDLGAVEDAIERLRAESGR